jgi:predicted transcriptional regulator
MTDETTTAIELAAELTIAWLSNHHTRATPEDVRAFLKSMHHAVVGLSAPTEPAASEEAQNKYTGAVTARKSLASPDYIISMIDGKQYKTLTRHLNTNGLTPAEYKARYGLRGDYPMTAPTYSEARRAMAKKIGLGFKGRQAKAIAKEAAPVKAAKRGRPAKVRTAAE